MNEAVAVRVVEGEERKKAQEEAKKKKPRKPRLKASAPDDLRAACFVFFRSPEADEDKNRWYCLANKFQKCSGSVRKLEGAIAKTGNFVDHCNSCHQEWYKLVEASFKQRGKVGAETQFTTLCNGASVRFEETNPLEELGYRAKAAP